MAVSFIGGGNRSTRRKPSTCRSHWQTLSHNVVSCTPRLNGIRTQTLVVIYTDWIGSCKSNYHTITNTTAPICFWGYDELEKILQVTLVRRVCGYQRGCRQSIYPKPKFLNSWSCQSNKWLPTCPQYNAFIQLSSSQSNQASKNSLHRNDLTNNTSNKFCPVQHFIFSNMK